MYFAFVSCLSVIVLIVCTHKNIKQSGLLFINEHARFDSLVDLKTSKLCFLVGMSVYHPSPRISINGDYDIVGEALR